MTKSDQILPTRNETKKEHRKIIFFEDQFEILDFAGPAQVMAVVNKENSCYDMIPVSVAGGLVLSTAGIPVQTRSLSDSDDVLVDTILVVGGCPDCALGRRAAVEWVCEQSRRARRICGIGLGIELLHEAGLVPRNEGAIHWRKDSEAGEIKTHCSRRPLAIQYKSFFTCVGMTTAIDFALSLIAEDFGHARALAAAKTLIPFLWRRNDSTQVSEALRLQINGRTKFATLHDWIVRNLGADLCVERLAELSGMTPRTFARLYRQETGLSPALAVEGIRAEAAGELLKSTDLSSKQIASACGFGSQITLRRAVLRRYGVTPTDMRGRDVADQE